ncbi:hypothetical protein BBBOND_0300560 [Babesia bigemina]|uniref:C3H1-type domain-containing protein n=1 Tax=Babesia bigemina TaxID=5866 RepID=A0A061D618_BABBI|nr:hypothetical protein BBBOND_0300560 [Babesia bigemina]CDR96151.1 hypothetical protein BBBOND_0300560 [Babesia bigemina]|eukprot:XP_012768337.1 hypothetical protein BBBOND_0300560 [Babesia bigemina]
MTAPKKLTDCPENLREAIDWLLQVRHGNDNGLGELAKALKKFIDEAIEKAYTTNFDALLKLLNSAKSYNCCKDKVAAIEKLKDSKNLTPNTFENLKSQCEGIKNCYKSHLEDSQQKAYDEIECKLEQLDGLNKSLIGLTNGNQCKDLFENLCTGLQKFLGFNPTSKGYDGSGIVYSDLDRLCDAVMAFLHGVLESVKTYDAVTTYDEKLNEGYRLSNVLERIERSIGQGVAEFGECIKEVDTWIGRFEKEIKKKTDAFMKPLKNLKNDVLVDRNLIDYDKEHDIAYQISEWKKRAGQYIAKVGRSEKALKDIAGNLKAKLSPKISLLKQATENFLKSVRNEDLNNMFKLADEQMFAVMSYAGSKAKQRIKNLQQSLILYIRNLQSKLGKLKSEQFSNLLKSVNSGLHSSLNAANYAIDHFISTYGKDVVDGLTPIVSRALKLKDKVAAEKAVLKAQIKLMGDKLNEVNNLYTKVRIPEELVGFQGGGEWDMNTFIVQVTKQIENNIDLYVDNFGKALYKGVDMAVTLTPGHVPGLEALEGDKELKEKLGYLGSLLESAVADKNNGGLGYNIETVLKYLNDAKKVINGEWGNFSMIVGNAMKTALKGKVIAGVNDPQIFKLITNAVRTGINKLQGAVDGIITNHLNEIKRKLTELQTMDEETTTSGSLSDLQQQADDLNKAIDSFLSNTVGNTRDTKKDAKRTVFAELNYVRDQVTELGRSIADVMEKVDDVGKELTSCIGEAEALLIMAPNEAERVMETLCKEVNSKIERAFTELQDKAKDLYSERKKTEVEALEDIIEKQLRDVENLIKDDLANGVNGFLRKIKKTFIPKAYEIKSIPTTSGSKARNTAIIVQNAFTQFMSVLLMQEEVMRLEIDVSNFASSLDSLLREIYKNQHFDYVVTDKLKTLDDALTSFSAETLNDAPKYVLYPLKVGLLNFTAQLGHAYVNRYSGVKMGKLLEVKPSSKNQKPAENQLATTQPPHYDLTPEGRNCAKVCLTILEMVNDSWWKLIKACKNNSSNQINLDEGKRLGFLFYSRGYNVVTGRNKQDGELRNKDAAMTGDKIRELCEKEVTISNSNALLGVNKTGTVPIYLLLRYLNDRVDDYTRVCHLRHIGSPKAPTNVNQMLHWLSGLSHNSVYGPLCKYFKQVIPKPGKYKETPYDKIPDDELNLPATIDIKYNNLKPTLAEVCAFARRVLICILGHGHADGRYACEFSTNADGLDYPSSSSACFDTLVDVLNRLYDQLYFVYVQCYRESDDISWRDCWYGRYVGGSDWRCNEKQCPNQMGGQTCPQIANQNADQKCDQHPKCGLKSPLQSFLEDGLPGFLPHSFSKPGCKLECTVSNHRGIPCKTPMGFADISVTASRTSKGERIMKVLGAFCGQQDSPLTKLCGVFICLLQKPPQTLGDMFSFYFCYLNEWGKNSKEHKKDAFDKAVAGAYFGVSYPQLNVSSIWLTSNHAHKTHGTGDLYSLYSCDCEGKSEITCGRYMKPFGLNTWLVFSNKNANRYLSWIVYLTETFYDLLDKLYKNCCNNCNSPGTKCHGRICSASCEVKSAYESDNPSKKVEGKHHTKDCKSIAQCAFTRPTLYNYGFVLNSLTNLSGRDSVETKRTCGDFCRTLEKVISKNISDGAPLPKLIYVHIPEFLWKIREPFSYLVLALWSLSLLYLFYVLIGRLDTLHIRSHLRSLSSHKIAAQSLLAAARVGKLSKISYLQA